MKTATLTWSMLLLTIATAIIISTKASAQSLICATPVYQCAMMVFLPPGSPCMCTQAPGFWGQVIVQQATEDEGSDRDPEPPKIKHHQKKKKKPSQEDVDDEEDAE